MNIAQIYPKLNKDNIYFAIDNLPTGIGLKELEGVVHLLRTNLRCVFFQSEKLPLITRKWDKVGRETQTKKYLPPSHLYILDKDMFIRFYEEVSLGERFDSNYWLQCNLTELKDFA